MIARFYFNHTNVSCKIGEMKLSIIIPCYNEAEDIAKNVQIVKDYLLSKNINYELILVNDGSKDNTKEVIEAIPGIIPLSYEINRGKGGAVKYGIEHSTGDYILFMDADLSTDINAIEKVIELAPKHDIIIGSRHCKDSVIKKKQPALRRFIGWCCRRLVNFRFGTHYKDTQCGFKAIKADLAKKIVSKQIITNFAFDVEYIYIAKLNQIPIEEIGITWSDDRGSTVSPFKSSMRFLKDLSKIKKNRKEYYFSEENKARDKDSSHLPIIIMILLFFILIGLFVAFLIIKGNRDNNAAKENEVNEKLNNRFLGMVNLQIKTNGFDEDTANKVYAVTYTDTYPTSFSLNIAASSDTKIYYYSLNYDYPENKEGYDSFTSFLLKDETLTFDDKANLLHLPIENEAISSEKSPIYKVSKNTSNELFVSGFYLSNDKYLVYYKKSYDKNNDPFLGAADLEIEKDKPLFSYYQFLAK